MTESRTGAAPAWRPLDAPSPYPPTARRPSRCPEEEVVLIDPEPGTSQLYVAREEDAT